MSFFDIFNAKKFKEENTRLNIRISYLEKQLDDFRFIKSENDRLNGYF